MEQMGVVRSPEVNQVIPSGALVLLDADPPLLIVAWKILPLGKLPTHKALVIIRGRVDQVAEDFFLRPSFRRRALLAFGLGKTSKDAGQRTNGKAQPLDDSRHRVH